MPRAGQRVPAATKSASARASKPAIHTDAEITVGRVLQRPGGRSERVRKSVADAVLAYFRDGQVNFSVGDVAERAGVHRTTVYRRWPTRADLVAEALRDHTSRLKVPDTGTWRRDLEVLMQSLAEFFSDPVEIGMNLSLAVGDDPQSNAVMVRHWNPVIDSMREPIRRAVERGEIDPAVDADALLELMMSPLIIETVMLKRTTRKAALKGLTDVLYRASVPNPRSH
jgi:AcrR family transcriptional regulator